MRDNCARKKRLEDNILFMMFAETFLLPFWHFGSIPFKLSFIYISFKLINGFRLNSFIMPFIGLIMLLWIGKIFSFFVYDEIEFYQTIYVTINYLLIVIGFLYALKLNPISNLNWLLPLGIMFSLINLFVFVFGPSYPFILSFYGLWDRLEEGLFLIRNPGIFTNPNGSALAGNCILIFWVVGRKFNLINYKKGISDILIFLFIALALISFQSRGGFLAYFATLLYFAFSELNFKSFIFSSGVGASLILFLIIVIPKIFPEQLEVFEIGINKVLKLNDEINGEIDKDDTSDGSRLYKLKVGLENVPYSPIFGVGSDRNSGKVLNNVWYHNDWLEVLVSCGIIGFLLLLLIFLRVFKLNAALAIPFIFGGMTNSFILTVQIVMFYFLFIGLIVKKKKIQSI
jgi:O-antigen ligase